MSQRDSAPLKAVRGTKLAMGWRVRSGLILLSTLLSQCSYARQLSVDEILNKVSETYRSLKSYEFLAEKRTELVAAGESRSPNGIAISNFHQSMEGEIELAAVEPGKARLRVKDGKLEILVVSDGQTTWAYMPTLKQYTEMPGSPSEVPGSSPSNQTAGILGQYRNLLVGRFRSVSQYSSIAALEKDNRVKIGGDKIDCYVVKLDAPQLTHEIWVDKNRFVVLRFKQTPLRPQEGIALQTILTVNLTEANVNTKLEDSLFKFTPPDKATKVPTLNLARK